MTGCKGLIKVVNTEAQDFLDKNPHMMLGIIWQLCRIMSTNKINIKMCNQLACLLEDWESLEDLVNMRPEELLLRWVNFHLKKTGQTKISNLGKDLADSRKLIHVMN